MCVNLYKVYVSGMVRLLPEIAQIDLFTKKPPPPMPRLGAGKHVSNVSPCFTMFGIEKSILGERSTLLLLDIGIIDHPLMINEGLACYEVVSQ